MNPRQTTQNGKTDKIEKDFSRLLERYNRSKQVIDQLYQSGGKNDTTIRSEKPFREEKDRDTELVSRDKYTKVRNLNKELKLTLKEYIDRTRDLEVALVGKDELIAKYEKELRDQQDNLYNQLQEQKEQILKEDQQARIIEDLKQQMQVAKQKVVKKKAKIQVLKEAQRTVEAKFEDQKQTFEKELDRVQKLCEDFSNEIKDTERKYIDVNEENEQIKQLINQKEEDRRYMELMIQEERENTNKWSQKLQEGQEEKKVLQITLENQGKRISDLEDQLKLADGRYQVLQGKFDQEKQGIKCDLQETLAKRKQKTKQLQQQIQSLEAKLQEKFKEEVITGKLIQDLKGDLLKLQQQLDDQRGKTDQALNEAQYKVQEVRELKNDIEKFRQTLQLQDEKLTKYDVQYQIDQKEKQKLLHEIELLDQENRRIQHLVYDQDREIDYIRQQQEQDILHVEKKVDSLVNELHAAREETNDWKRQCTDLKRQLQQHEEQSNQFKAKYLKSKQNTKNLENEQRFLEEKIKLLENEKLLGEREALKHTVVQQKSVQQSKIKVLDEIQNMIKQHKLRE